MRIDLDMTLEEIIMEGRGEGLHQPMDGDEVGNLMEYVKEVVNNHEGNTSDDEKKPMRAIFIDSTKETVEVIEFSGGFEEIQKILGVDCFTCLQLDNNGNTLYIDDEGLFKDDVNYFQIPGLERTHPYPLAGKGLILGTGDMGETISTKMAVPDAKFYTRGQMVAKFA